LPSEEPQVSAHAEEPHFALSSSVELWIGDERIGVRVGSPTAQLFLRYANALLAELPETRRA